MRVSVPQFFNVYSEVSRVVSVVFLLLMIIILVDFAHSIQEMYSEVPRVACRVLPHAHTSPAAIDELSRSTWLPRMRRASNPAAAPARRTFCTSLLPAA